MIGTFRKTTEFVIVTIKQFIILFSHITSVSPINDLSIESDLFQFLALFTIRQFSPDSCPKKESAAHASSSREHHYIAFDEYYNEPIGRSFGNCEIPFVTS